MSLQPRGVLTKERMAAHNEVRVVCDRVKIYTIGGVQIGLAGVGEKDERLTFPAGWTFSELLACPPQHWIRFATEDELEEAICNGESPRWYRFLSDCQEHIPKSFIHGEPSNGKIAYSNERLGLYGTTVTAMTQPLEQSYLEEDYIDDGSQINLDHIKTPPTPPPHPP